MMRSIECRYLLGFLILGSAFAPSTLAAETFEYYHEGFQGFIGTRLSHENQWHHGVARTMSDLPKATSSFTTEYVNTKVAIHFSADVELLSGAGMLVQAVLDGQPVDGGPIVLMADGSSDVGAHAYTWLVNVQPGIHTVQLQYYVMGQNPEMRIRNLTLKTVAGKAPYDMDGVSSKQAAVLNADHWVNFPDLPSQSLFLDDGDEHLIATLSSWLFADPDSGIEVRVLANGMPMGSSPIQFHGERINGGSSHRATFALPAQNVGASGWVTFQPQYRQIDDLTDNQVFALSRTFTAEAREPSHYVRASGSAYSSYTNHTNGTNWQPLPDSAVSLDVPRGSEITAQLTGNVNVGVGDGFYVRMRVDGQPITESTRYYKNFDNTNSSVAMDFATKYVNRDSNTQNAVIDLEWRSMNNDNASMWGYGTVVRAETMATPDLAEPHFGKEAFIGEHPKVVMILFDNQPLDGFVRVDPQELVDKITEDHGVNDYLAEVSGGRYQLDTSDIEVWGWYDFTDVDESGFAGPWIAGGTSPGLDWQDYDNYPPHDNDCDGYGPYRKAGDLYRAHAYQTAVDHGMDVTGLDRNEDGVIGPEEAVFILVQPSPDNDTWGYGWVRETATAYCNGDLLTVDGVDGPKAIKKSLGWQPGTSAHRNYTGLTHEMAHYIFNLDDTYMSQVATTTEPNTLSLMAGGYYGDRLSHLNAPHKLTMGWAEPVIVDRTDTYCIEDVKDSEEILILPQIAPYGEEYFALSHRVSEAANAAVFDNLIGDTGLAVWHVIDPEAPDGAVALNAEPVCDPNWLAQYQGQNRSRRGQRMVRPNNATSTANSLWDAATGDLLDAGQAGNLQCPTQYLSFSGGDSNGYQITNIQPVADGTCMDIEVPSCENRCGNYNPAKVCQCDASCAIFGDCCFDEPRWCN